MNGDMEIHMPIIIPERRDAFGKLGPCQLFGKIEIFLLDYGLFQITLQAEIVHRSEYVSKLPKISCLHIAHVRRSSPLSCNIPFTTKSINHTGISHFAVRKGKTGNF